MLKKILIFVPFLLMIVACGGGGGTTTTSSNISTESIGTGSGYQVPGSFQPVDSE